MADDYRSRGERDFDKGRVRESNMDRFSNAQKEWERDQGNKKDGPSGRDYDSWMRDSGVDLH